MTGCATSHVNCIPTASETCGTGAVALGQTYFIASDYCTPAGTPGTDSTYTLAMATAAAAAAPQPGSTCSHEATCTGVMSCPKSSAAMNAYYDDLRDTGGPCIVWGFATAGTGATATVSGHVFSATACECPYSTDDTWN
jgi:hypothetical protein